MTTPSKMDTDLKMVVILILIAILSAGFLWNFFAIRDLAKEEAVLDDKFNKLEYIFSAIEDRFELMGDDVEDLYEYIEHGDGAGVENIENENITGLVI